MAIPRAVQEQADKADEYLKGLENPVEEQEEETEEDEFVESKPVVDWEHKFRVLQGKYDAEVPRLNQELREIKDRLNQADQQRQQQAEQNLRPNFDELRDVESDEVVNAFQKQQEIIDKQNQIISDLRNRVDALGDNTAQSSERLFYSTLAQIVPDWATVNQDSRFLAWLGDIDPYTGVTRQQLLANAASNLDAQRAAFFFTSWKETVKKKSPQVSPKTQGSSDMPVQSKTYTAAEIKKFYDDITKGKYRHNPEERKAREDEYNRAQREGRITP